MAENQYVPFATGDGANTLTYSAYFNQPYVSQGFQPGVASSAAANTALRQVSTVAAGLAQFIADNQTVDVLDDGVPANITSKLTTALKGLQSASSVHYGVATGTGDAMVVTAVQPLVPTAGGAYQAGSYLVVKTPATANTTTAPTINASSIGNIAITKAGGTPLAKGDLQPTTWIVLFFDGVGCDYIGATPSDILTIVLANITATQILNITGGTGFSVVQSYGSYQPQSPSSHTLDYSFTAPAKGTVLAFSNIASTPQSGLANAVNIYVNGGLAASASDSVSASITDVASYQVKAGDIVDVQSVVSNSQALTYNTSQRLSLLFFPS